MRLRTPLSIVVALVVGAPMAASAAAPSDYVPTFTSTPLYLHANGSPIGNLDARDGKYLRWDGTKPTAGQPAVYIGNNYDTELDGNHNPVHQLTMQGDLTGDLENLAFDLYFVGWAQSTIKCDVSLSFQLVIDDQEVLNQDYEGSAGITWKPVDSTTNVARFALTNLWQASNGLDLAYGADVKHHVYLNVHNFYACNEFQWEYDSSTQPSGFVTNLTNLKGYFKVDVLDPPPPLPSGASRARVMRLG